VPTSERHSLRYSLIVAGLIFSAGITYLAKPSTSEARVATVSRGALPSSMVHSLRAIPRAAQDAGQSAPPAGTPPAATPPGAPAAPAPVVLPEGDGKPIATQYCQACHRLTNLTKAHKNLDDWKDTIHLMIDRGAAIPDDKVDTLATYLAQNFGPKDANADAGAPGTTSGASAPAQGAAPPSAPATPAAPATVELPEGDGKAIAMASCQACHRLTNLTKAHKSLDDWKDTVQLMIDRGANVPDDKVETLVQYLAKNFGPKDPAAPPASAPPAATPAQ
jgi:mono/diheme cytochrome c family protein